MAGITLAQLAQTQTDATTKFVINNILRECRFMDKLPFLPVSSLTVKSPRVESYPTAGAWRSLNEGYSSTEDAQMGEVYDSLFGFGTDITYDNVITKLNDYSVDPVQFQTEMKLKAISMEWNYTVINGDHASDPKQFEGLKKRVAGMPSRQTVWFAASNAAPLDPTASAGNSRIFMNKFNEAWHYCNSGAVNAILCNEDFILGFQRVLTYMQMQGNFMDITKDSFGRQEVSYRGVPFIDMGYKKDMSTEVIPTTETAGDAGADSTSVYLVSINTTEGVHGLELEPLKVYDPLNGGEMESKPSKMKRVDWWNGIASFGSYGIVRARNLSNLAGFTA